MQRTHININNSNIYTLKHIHSEYILFILLQYRGILVQKKIKKKTEYNFMGNFFFLRKKKLHLTFFLLNEDNINYSSFRLYNMKNKTSF